MPLLRGRPSTAGELTGLRRRLRSGLQRGAIPAGSDEGERLLLVFEELTSNAVRHGRPPVGVTVTFTGGGWLVSVSDAAGERLPAPAAGRDPGQGGMGLSMVATISDEHGWMVDGDCKTVWARIPLVEVSDLPLSQQARAAVDRARSLADRLAATAARISLTLEGIATEAGALGRPDRAQTLRLAAQRARRHAERVTLAAAAAAAAAA